MTDERLKDIVSPSSLLLKKEGDTVKFSRGTNYALHTMLHLAMSLDNNKPIGVQQLAEQQSVSPTYLSKILTKLAKEGWLHPFQVQMAAIPCVTIGNPFRFLM
ncbi:Rrf2 family transcriptional regulator [Bacillus sp. JCM 19046]|nr:Rrf2 family transcriptional regulator [Bacillus sp. JCM 19046]